MRNYVDGLNYFIWAGPAVAADPCPAHTPHRLPPSWVLQFNCLFRYDELLELGKPESPH